MKTWFWVVALLSFTYIKNSFAHVVADDMAAAANKFLAALSGEQKSKVSFEFKDNERVNWHYIPRDRKGLPFADMNSEQQRLAHALIQSAMSHHGYTKATNIISLESVLQELEGVGRRFTRDPALYYISVFGKPDPKGTWGWRLEGHHLAVNMTVIEGKLVTGTPSFFGANPAEVRQGPRKGLRILAEEEDLARELIKSLSPENRKAAIFTETALKEIVTEAKRKVEPLEKTGIEAGKLSREQKDMLLKVIKLYVERYRPELAKDDLAKIMKAGVDKVQFAWAGGIE